MTSTSKDARSAGFLYLLLVIACCVTDIPGTLFVHGNASATANNIAAHETLFRLGIVGQLSCGTILIFVALALYRLFAGVDQKLAVLVVILGGVLPAAIGFFTVLNDAAALILIRGADFLSAFDKRQREALATLFLRIHDQEKLAAMIFWGLWLMPLGMLVYRSRFLPRFLGVWLIVNGFGYLAMSLTGLLLPHYADAVGKLAFPALTGEVAFVLWLLIRGPKEQYMRQLATALLILIALSTPAIADDSVAAGRAALDRRDSEQAIAQFEKAVAQKPNSSEAHYYLGVAYSQKAETANMLSQMSLGRKAIDAWARALELDPNSFNARLRLIEFYVSAPAMAGGSADKAMELAAEAKKRDAFDGHRAYTRIYTVQKKYDVATKEMREAVRDQPKSAKTHYFLGNALLNQQDWKTSQQEYETALSLDAAYMPTYFRIGHLAARSESNYARGEEALRKYIVYKPADDEPKPGTAWYWLGMIQEKQGKKAEAKQSYLMAQKLAPELKETSEALKRLP
jgi:tetratricopeptide (TPR) repeat protein